MKKLFKIALPLLIIAMLGTTCFAQEDLVISSNPNTENVSKELSVYEQRQADWNHNYKMLNEGVFLCDYMDNYHNETKEPIDKTNCGIARITLQQGLECEPDKIFLQVVNTETQTKYGMISLREGDNKTFTYEFYLPEGTYLVDYVIAEGDLVYDFYIEPNMFEMKSNGLENKYIPLKRQSNAIIDSVEYYPEDVERLLTEEAKKEVALEIQTSEETVYAPPVEPVIKEAEPVATEENTKDDNSIDVVIVVVGTVLLLLVVAFVAKHVKNNKK